MKSRFIAALLVVWACATTAATGQQPDAQVGSLPISEVPSVHYYQMQSQPLTYAQQRARFESEQRLYRIEWNNWIGYSPSRPTLNASYMSGIAPRYYIPSRGILVHTGMGRSWYW